LLHCQPYSQAVALCDASLFVPCAPLKTNYRFRFKK
jgi:hypothetical protein